MSDVRVWWVQCKPFPKESRDSKEAKEFQNLCLEERLIGIGWRTPYFAGFSGRAYSEYLADLFKTEINNRSFSSAQNKFVQICKGDVVFTRLNEVYYVGVVSSAPIVSYNDRLSWCCDVEEWRLMGGSIDLPHHVRGKLSSKNYQTTVQSIEGLSALTLMKAAGIEREKGRVTEDDFFKAFGDEDLEDLVGYYMTLENNNFVFLPSSCKKGTPGIEYVMYDPMNGEKIACQTKVNRKIDIREYANDTYKKYKKIYLFSGAGYDGIESIPENIKIIERSELFESLKANSYFKDIISKYFEIL